ncbi:MAG: MBL fold metallo-hydrolase [Acholeplasmataceae bacterium]|jgi:glyoxylase-like metal-dependent hydrolase (beta-lactamase superfamily II)|nr:MBL fold metallo-hydrolase [Acholeplasmataceae bacterium]
MKEAILLELSFEYNKQQHKIHPTLLVDDREVMLVDCGYQGFLPKIETEMLKHSIDPKRLTKVFITHHDDDHMGGLFELKMKYPEIQVISGQMESGYISGKMKSLRLIQAEELLKTMDEKMRPFGEAFCQRQRELKHVLVDQTVQEGDLLDICGGTLVMETPGHMPGHLSLYLKEMDIVITGDAAVVENNELHVANPFFTLDMETAKKSLKRLVDIHAKTYYCFHGGIYQTHQ